jgi:hypothetical protein
MKGGFVVRAFCPIKEVKVGGTEPKRKLNVLGQFKKNV